MTDVIPTGTLTESEVRVLAATAEKRSEHPVARAIFAAAGEKSIAEPENFEALPGMGISAVANGKKILIGNPKLIRERSIDMAGSVKDTVEKLENEGKTVIVMAVNGKVEGVLGVADTVKADSKAAIEKLKAMGIEVYMITGDNRKTAESIARETGITHVLAEVMPQNKAEEVKKLQAAGKKVAMVGDGINDAPALVMADVGMAMGSGHGHRDRVVRYHAHSRQPAGSGPQPSSCPGPSCKVIKQNLFWAFFYNVIGIPIAAGLLYPFFGILLNPMFAALAMAFSSVSVVSNSLRLKRWK